MSENNVATGIKSLDAQSVHRITSGQVVIDLQTAVKELVENSLDAGATNIDIRFKDYGLKSIQVVDNGCGIAPEDYPYIALKHHTSKLSSFGDLSTLLTFGFRGEALSSLCALSEDVNIITCTANQGGLGDRIDVDNAGKVTNVAKIARQHGTTVTITNLFKPLPVRRKEFERNVKREFGKALGLLNAYALVPCVACSNVAGSQERRGVRLTVSNQTDDGRKTTHISAPPTISLRSSISSLWGPKALDQLVALDISFSFFLERQVRSTAGVDGDPGFVEAKVKGLISKFELGCGRSGTDRQFFYVNGRPWDGSKIQKVFNEVYRSFNANQSPFIVSDLQLPTTVCDVNVSPDKRTILLQGEGNLLAALKNALENTFAPSRSTYDVEPLSTQDYGKKSPQARSQIAEKRRQLSAVSQNVPDTCDEQHDACGQSQAPGDVTSDSPRSPQPLESRTKTVFPIGSSPSNTTQSERLDLNLIDSGRMNMSSFVYSSPISANTSAQYSSPVQANSSTVNVRPTPSRYVPTVLNTSGAIWNRGSPSEGLRGEGEPPRKKWRSATDGGDNDAKQEEVGRESEKRAKEMREEETQRNESSEEPPTHSRSSQDARTGPWTSARVNCRRAGVDEDVDHDRDQVEENIPKGMRRQERLVEKTKAKRTTRTQASREVEVEPELMEVDELLDDTPIDTNLGSRRVARIATTGGRSTNSTKSIDLTETLSDESDDSCVAESEIAVSTYEEFVSRAEVVRSKGGTDRSLQFDISRISDIWQQLGEHASSCGPENFVAMDHEKATPVPLAFNAEGDDTAEAGLSRVIDKKDFGDMEIVGQFNRGFIITRRRQGCGKTMDDLFIIDQHAADEKYNFEALQQTTKINSQKLLRPRALELTASDELLAVDNLETLKRNGFEIAIVENTDATQRHRLQLVAQPVSKGTDFDMKDLEELIHLLRDSQRGQMVRCSKARAMFAMRACRKSVMVGMPLGNPQMTAIVRHMGTMNQPWNCPHGRPTMRHLTDIRAMNRQDVATRAAVDWRSLGQESI